MSTNGSSTQDVSEGTIRNLFRAISSKTSIFATKEERDNVYRFSDGSSLEYLLSSKGWVSIDQFIQPSDYIVAKDGTIWFMAAELIYYQTGYQDVNAAAATQNMALEWKSISFDSSLLGEGINKGEMFWVDGVFMTYSSPANLTMKVYLDGTLFDTITFLSSKTYDDPAIKYGGLGHKVEIEVTGTVNSATKVIISSLGFRWRKVAIGNRV